jgi:predicted phosphoribosyltransferase
VVVLAREELAELQRREQEYRQGRSLIDLHRRTAILVDDGLPEFTGGSQTAPGELPIWK